MRAAAAAKRQRPLTEAKPYVPPADWSQVALRDLLQGTARWPTEPKQLNLIDKLAPVDRVGQSQPQLFRVFVAGEATLMARPCVSVIGTRNVSPEGAARARRVARELVARGVVIVSGLAAGVDTEAMTAAIAHGGRTIGVIGTPLDRAYPAKNAELQEEVYRKHLLISQFPFGSTTYKSSFPQRNRLMAFISDASVIIEASDTSGTLHQAAECQRLGRWLFIAKSVAEDPNLTWPKSFLGQPRTAILEATDQIATAIAL